MSLYECFMEVPDPRKESGLRLPLPALLCMVTMCYLSGHSGYRSTATFMKGNKEEFMDIFDLKHPPIGKTQLRTVLQMLDFEAINQAFSKWMNSFVSLKKGSWLSGDGKALVSTVTNPHNSEQGFEMMVRLFSQELQVVTQLSTASSKKGEMKSMEELLKTLDFKGVIITLDALHCQKKR